MAIVTISRQLGSNGHDVAKQLAERLGYRFTYRDMINEAARRASTPEVALATIDELDLLGLTPAPRERKAYCQAVQQVMMELAQQDNVVILGRAGQIVLRDVPGVLHVRIVAPKELRVQRVAEQHHVSPEAALSQVEASDKNRRNYLRRFYHASWDDPEMYDLVINTARLAVQDAVDLICHCVLQQYPSLLVNDTTGGELS
jgi:cytidylate kinase